jgi:hypothetical protein
MPASATAPKSRAPLRNSVAAFYRNYTSAAAPRNMPPVTFPCPFRWTGIDGLAVSYGVVIAMIALGYAKRAWSRLARSRTRSWPLAEGRIELVEAGERNWWDFSAHLRSGVVRSATNVAALGYSYHVAGVVYAGTYKREFEAEEDAWEFARKLKGGTVMVHYNVNNPSVSVLSESSIETRNTSAAL